MAVLILYFHKLNPFSPRKTQPEKKSTWRLWGMVVIGCVPAAIIGFLLDDFFNEHFYNAWTVAVALIVYGVIFILLERHNRKRMRAYLEAHRPRGRHARAAAPDSDEAVAEAEAALCKVQTVDDIDWKTALKIGCFQVLAIIPAPRAPAPPSSAACCAVARARRRRSSRSSWPSPSCSAGVF